MARDRRREDLDALRRLHTLAARLVLTVPFGPVAAVEGFERVYDRAGLDELLTGWTARAELIVARNDRVTWERGGEVSGRAVAMVVADA